MRILHIVPAAFEYFEVIRKEAFDLADSLNALGFESELITLQYSPVSRRFEKKVAEETKKRVNFERNYSEDEILEKFNQHDIIHLHIPFLGMGKKILKFKKNNPQKKFVITLYENLPYVDFFTIIIWLYNSYYVKRLINLADFVVAGSEQIFRRSGGFSYLKDEKKFVPLDSFVEFILENNFDLTKKINNLKLNKSNIHTAVAYGELYRLLGGE